MIRFIWMIIWKEYDDNSLWLREMMSVLEVVKNGITYTMFLVQSPYGIKFDVYMGTEKGPVYYNAIVEEIRDYCSNGELITLQPSREEWFINILKENGVLIATKKYVEGKFERQSIYTINIMKAEKIGLGVVSPDTVYQWQQEKKREQRGRN